MTPEFSPSLAWLSDFGPAFGSPVDLVLEPRTEDPAAPKFDYGQNLPEARTILLSTSDPEREEWRDALAAALKGGEWRICLTNLLAIPPRSLRNDVDGEPLPDGAAFLAEILKNAADGNVVVALAPAGILLNQRTAPLRAWLAKAQRVEWVIYLGPEAAQLLGAPPQLALALLVIRSGRHASETPGILRLVNLAGCPRTDWVSVVLASAKRGGGEVGPSIILRDPVLDGAPWTYERFSKRFAARREDARQLGTLRSLGDFAKDMVVGLHRAGEAQRVVELDETGVAPSGAIACFGGRSIGSGGKLGSPVCAVVRAGLPDEVFLQPGDVLVRSLVGLGPDRAPILAAMVSEEALPATFDRTCIRIRWAAGVRPHVADLLTGYLNSTHARDWLIARGVQTTLNVDALRRLEVPDPSNELLVALEVLGDAQEQYRVWANEVADARRGLFATTSFAEQLPVLLRRQRTEIERLRAARDSESLDYQIRNYYPHPIALRRELILQTELGRQCIDAVLDCAEHLLTLLAVLAILQESSASIASGPVRARLLSFSRDGSLHLDWGKCFALLEEGVKFTARHPNPLTLPFPELAELAAPMADESSTWHRAEHQLREWRNKQSHLQRSPEPELKKMSEEFLGWLDCLLETASFIGTLRLVRVADYELSQTTGERRATFQLLQGISPAFQRCQRKVPSELPRGAVGFLNRHGEFVSAFPWFIMDSCPVCKRPEVFVFNRYDRNQATFVAMETGHPQDKRELGPAIAALLQTEPPA